MRMKSVVSLSLLFLATVCAAQDISGDWQGTLKEVPVLRMRPAPNIPWLELRVVLHLARVRDGNLSGTLDSLDQGIEGMPLTRFAFENSKLRFYVQAAKGSYEGVVSSDGSAIKGTWYQFEPFDLGFSRAVTPIKTRHAPAPPSEIDGAWSGTIDVPERVTANEVLTEVEHVAVKMNFHVANTADGLTATMDCEKQGISGWPATNVGRSGDSLTIEMKQIGGRFVGKIGRDLGKIRGTWSQDGDYPLVLRRNKPRQDNQGGL